jgi:hypothetical protein
MLPEESQQTALKFHHEPTNRHDFVAECINTTQTKIETNDFKVIIGRKTSFMNVHSHGVW